MATPPPDGPIDPQPNPQNNKARSSYLALGIVFVALGIGMSFGDSSFWVAFLAVGVTFLAVSGDMKTGRKVGKPEPPDQD